MGIRRKNLSFGDKPEEILAYNFLNLLGGRVQSSFISKLIANHLKQHGISTLNGLDQKKARDIASTFSKSASNGDALNQLFAIMLEKGLYLAPINAGNINNVVDTIRVPDSQACENVENHQTGVTFEKKIMDNSLLPPDSSDDDAEEDTSPLTMDDVGLIDQMKAFF